MTFDRDKRDLYKQEAFNDFSIYTTRTIEHTKYNFIIIAINFQNV